MAEVNFELSGGKAVVAIIVLAIVIVIRLVSIGGTTDDKDLIRQLELNLTSFYYPGEVDRLKAAMASGDSEEIDLVAKSVTSTKLKIDSVKTSYALFDFSSPKKVIVKVNYSLVDDSGVNDQQEKYFKFQHGGIMNNWSYQYESNMVSYYLNFL